MTASELIERLEQLEPETPVGIFDNGEITDDLLFLVGEINDQHVYFLTSYRAVQRHAGDDFNDGSRTDR